MVGNIRHYVYGSSVSSRKNFTEVKLRCRKCPRFQLSAYCTADKGNLYRQIDIWTDKSSWLME
jgi:hypothetical protein